MAEPAPEIQREAVEAVTPPVAAIPAEPQTQTAPAAVPQTSDAAPALAAPESATEPGVRVATDDPVFPSPLSLPPQVPEIESDLVVETAPSQPVPVTEDVPVEIIADPVETMPVETVPPVVADQQPAQTEEADAVPPVAVADSMAPQSDAAAVGSEVAADIAPAVPPAPGALAAPEGIAPQVPEITLEPLPEEAPEPPAVVTIVDPPQSRMPVGAPGVKVNRVIGAAAAAEQEAAQAETPVDDTAPALQRFAADYENPDAKPLMSLLLIDDGSFGEGPRAVAEIPFPVTVIIDAETPNATERMAAYRALGIEVGMTFDLPQGATAADVSVALEASLSSLPEAVVLVDTGETGRAERDQIIAGLVPDGLGFLSLGNGLNNGIRTALAAGVPAAEIYRALDLDGQDARVIRRFLDQAAFRARQESGVILLGQVRGETLSALVLWGTADRAGKVAMVPVSAVLSPQ